MYQKWGDGMSKKMDRFLEHSGKEIDKYIAHFGGKIFD